MNCALQIMDLKTYNTILAQKGKNPYEIPDGTATGDTRGHIAFRKDLVKKKVVWFVNISIMFFQFKLSVIISLFHQVQ